MRLIEKFSINLQQMLANILMKIKPQRLIKHLIWNFSSKLALKKGIFIYINKYIYIYKWGVD